MSSIIITSLLKAINDTDTGKYSIQRGPGYFNLLRYSDASNRDELVFHATSALGLIAMLKIFLQGVHHGLRR